MCRVVSNNPKPGFVSYKSNRSVPTKIKGTVFPQCIFFMLILYVVRLSRSFVKTIWGEGTHIGR